MEKNLEIEFKVEIKSKIDISINKQIWDEATAEQRDIFIKDKISEYILENIDEYILENIDNILDLDNVEIKLNE